MSPATTGVARRLDMVPSSLRLCCRGEGGVWATRAESAGTLAQEGDDRVARGVVVDPRPVPGVALDPDRCTPQCFGIAVRELRRYVGVLLPPEDQRRNTG